MKMTLLVVLAVLLTACGAHTLRRAPCEGRGVRINPVEKPLAVAPPRGVDAPGRSTSGSHP